MSFTQYLPIAKAQNQPLAGTPNPSSGEELGIRMAQISSSNKPDDIATLAYIWGFPLVTMERQFNYVTNPNIPPGVGRGPPNTISTNSCARALINASFTDVVSPNADTLYCFAQIDLTKEPVVLVVPPIQDRYYVFQFLDAYTNNFEYLGQRGTGESGGTYLITGPNWNGPVPEGITKIWSPTNLVWMINRILVKGPSDLPNVLTLQDKIILRPLSIFVTRGSAPYEPPTSERNTSKQIPIGPQPELVAKAGIKIFDEIGKAMNGNPLNPPDPILIGKFASIGIGPGKVPSRDANDTIKASLQKGITEGQKMINQKVAGLGTVVNGWYETNGAVFATDYLYRAAIAQKGLGANIAQEAFYPLAFSDKDGKPLSGNKNYLIHFSPGLLPPVDAFWSITMYNNKSLFVDNPINRYSIGKYTDGVKNNTDNSLDIYIQKTSPGKDKESNWLPSPDGPFSIALRLYLPQPQILNGTWVPPAVQPIG